MAILKYDGSAAAVTAAAVSSQYSTAAAETMTGGTGADSLWGGDGDVLRGGLGDDTYTLAGTKVRIDELPGSGADKVAGWTSLNLADFPDIENLQVGGEDRYGAGGSGDNVVEGDASSRQQLYGGQGQDVLIGGGGADTFIVVKGQGNDVIQDFSADDVVRLRAGFTSFAQVQSAMSQVGGDVKLDLGNGDGLMFRGATVAQFTAANFQLGFDASKLGALTFSEEFSGQLSLWDAESNPAGIWRPDYGFEGAQGAGSYTLASNGERQIYTSPYFRGHNGDFAESPFVSNGDGTLSIWARPSTSPEIFGYGYISGAITTKASFAQQYGYFEMRADLPDAAGAWPAFWLVAADGSWPPELDVMETLTHDPDVAHTTEHSGAAGAHAQQGYAAFIPETADGFHTYGALWTQADIAWFVDGAEVFRAPTPADMHKPMFMIANMALGGWGGPVDAGRMPAEFKIDYIRAYALADGSGAAHATPPAVPGPSAAADPSHAAGAGQVIAAANDAGSQVAGGNDADTLVASRGADRLTGGDGADIFDFNTLPWSAGHIADFKPGTDILDLRDLLDEAGYAGSDPVAEGYLMLIGDGAGGTKVYLDPDGQGTANPWPFQITTLEGVHPGALRLGRDVLFSNAAGASGGEAPATPPAAPAVGSAVILRGAGELIGGAGADTITGADAANYLRGGDGDDLMFGGAVFDDMHGNKGDDTLRGGGGDDWVVGGQGADALSGGGGDDLVLGNIGDDTLSGDLGDDVLRGGQANDLLRGGAGDDWLSGDRGADTVTGGTGADIFHAFAQAGLDVVTDFNWEEGDRVMLDPGTQFTVAYEGGDTIVRMGGDNEMVLKGVDCSAFASGWILGA